MSCLMGDAESLEDLKDIEKALCQLRELLSTALPDDLLDDDTASFSSHDSSGSLSVRDGHQVPPSPSPDPWVRLGKGLSDHHKLIQRHQQLQQTSTPNGFGRPPPLKTPAPVSQQNGYREHPGNEQHYGHADTNGYHHHLPNGQEFPESSDEDTPGPGYPGRAVDGTGQGQALPPGHPYQGTRHVQVNVDPQGIAGDIYVQNHGNNLHGEQDGGGGGFPATNGYRTEESSEEYARGEAVGDGAGAYPAQTQEYNPPRAQMQHYSPQRQRAAAHPAQRRPAPLAQEAPQGEPLSNTAHPADHRVRYRGDGSAVTNPHPADSMPQGPHSNQEHQSVGDRATAGFAHNTEGDQLQRQFLGAGGDEETRQMGQLQILYKARGRELDQLKSQLQVLREESGRETRILNHQLSLAKGEKEGMLASYEQCQRLLVEAQQDNSSLKGQLQAAQAQIQALNAAKHEVEAKLQATETAIESLTGQLTELQRSQPLARAREQQDGLLKSLQERYEQEVTRLKERVDSGERLLEEKSEAVTSLREELSKVSREACRAKLEQGNTVNTLTNQLQLSQKQCRDLLDTGSLKEINLLRVQLQEAASARTFSQDMASTLQEELTEMKEQLQMYESAMELGAVNVTSPKTVQSSKSFAVRNLAQTDWKTPQSQGSSSDTPAKTTPDDLIQGLRKELERSLQSNRAKRAQVSRLQAELRAARTDTEELRKQRLQSEATARDKEVRFRVMEAQLETSGTTSSASETARPTSASVGDLQEKVGRLEAEREELSEVVERLRAEEGRLNEANADLKKQMAQMVSEWDQDKKADLDRVQKTCLQLHEDSSKHLRGELVAEFQSEREMLKEAHQHQLKELRRELEEAQNELVGVKGLYVEVCAEKNSIEDTVTKTLTAETANQLAMAKKAWQAEQEVALAELRQSLESSQRAALVTAKSAWRQETEREQERRVRDQVALAKEQWTETMRAEEMKNASKATTQEWKAKLDSELQQAKADSETIHRDQLSKQREELKAAQEREQAQAIRKALSTAKVEWSQTAQAEAKENLKKAIEMARAQWMKEDPDRRLEEAVASARSQWIGQQVDLEMVKKEWMAAQGEEEIAKRVALETKALEAKHLADITSLQGVLEKGRQKIKQETEEEKEAALGDVRAQLEKAHRETLADASAEAERDKTQSVEVATKGWQERLDKLMTDHQGVLQEVNQQWQKEKQELLEAQEAAVASLRAEATSDQEELRSKYEAELERGIEEAVRSAREQWSQNCDAELRRACDEILESKERVWKEERADLQEHLADAASQLREHQRQSERHRKKHSLHRQKLEKEIAALREQLQDADREMKQTEFNLRRELGQLQSRLRGASAAAVEAVEAEMERMKRRHEAELTGARQRRTDVADSDTQTPESKDDSATSGAVQEIKAHYLRTVKKIKVDVMKRMADMRENCRQTIHTEVLKERHSTAKKLRRYYLQCLQQFLSEDQMGSDHTRAQSAASKLAAMAKALELPPDQLLAGQSVQPGLQSILQPTSERSRETLGSPSPGAGSQGGERRDRSRSSGPAGCARPARDEDRKRPQPRACDSRSASSQPGQDTSSSAGDDDKSVTSQSSLDSCGTEPARLPVESSVDSGSGCGSASDRRAELGAPAWERTETGLALSTLPIRPREFNPKPERLPSRGRDRPSASASLAEKQPTLAAGNATLRSGGMHQGHPSRRGNGASSSTRPHLKESVGNRSSRSRENSPAGSPSDSEAKRKPQMKAPAGTSIRKPSSDFSNHGAKEGAVGSPRSASPRLRSLRTRDHPPASDTSKITMRSRKSEPFGADIGASQQSPFMRPIAGSKQTGESRRGPLRVPPPCEKTAAMLASLPSTVTRPVPQMAGRAQVPSPGPYRATDTSTASLDTVYNDLPASLGAVADCPLEDLSDVTLDKVVRFEQPAHATTRDGGKSHLGHAQGKFPAAVSSFGTVNSVPSLQSQIKYVPKGQMLRSSEKLTYMLQQDSGFVSPQTEAF